VKSRDYEEPLCEVRLVAVPKLAEGRGCMVGLTGRVSFNDSRPEATAATAAMVYE
jgi:hypothetical protein